MRKRRRLNSNEIKKTIGWNELAGEQSVDMIKTHCNLVRN